MGTMADRKGEGIALLSVYADEDEEDVDGDEVMPDAVSAVAETGASAEAGSLERPPASGGAAAAALPAGARGGKFGIVDYAHDEAAMSPEPDAAEQASVVDEMENWYQPVDLSNEVVEQSQPSTQGEVDANADAGEAPAAVQEESPAREVGLGGENAASEAQLLASEDFDDFLPPPTQEKCSPELQTKFARYLALKNGGRSFNEELRHSKGYRNPDFLQRAVRYQEIDQIGSCFDKEVFDPHGYHPCDYYDAIYAEQKKEMARKQNRRVEHVRGTAVTTATAGIIADARPKAPLQLITGQKGFMTVPSSGQPSILGRRASASVHLPVSHANGEAPVRREGRSKKSKWDKV